MKTSSLRLGLGVFVMFGIGFLARPAQAVTITTITPTVFTDDFTVNGNCTLREAIAASNTKAAVDACPAGGATNLILLSAGTYTLTIPGAGEDLDRTGDLDVTANDLTISGTGENATTISANGASFGDRIIDTPSAASLSLRNLTITGGYVTNDAGGGILSDGILSLSSVNVTGNTAAGTTGTGGGILFEGSQFFLDQSSVANNTAEQAGGVEVDTGGAWITSSAIVSNTGGSTGGVGGLINFATVTMSDSTVGANVSGIDSGGIYNAGTMTLTNVTIAHNSATAGAGGITNDTGTVNLKNTIIAYNIDTSNSAPDCGGNSFNSQGYNIVKIGTGCTFTGIQTGNQLSVDPQLSTLLQNNLGTSKNYYPISTSPAIDAGTNTGCSSFDQRSFTRPTIGLSGHTAICDIGAIEADYAPPVLTLVSASTDATAPIKPNGLGVFTVKSSEGGTFSVAGSCTRTSQVNIDTTTKIVTASTAGVALTEGVKTCTLIVTDPDGNSAAMGIDYRVDGTAPSLLLLGPNPQYLKRGQPFLEYGVMAFDAGDPFLSTKIRTTSHVNPLAGGSYTELYNATDAAGNDTQKYVGTGPHGQVYRTVYVLPTIDPVTMSGRSVKIGSKTITPFPGYVGAIFARKVNYAKNDATYVFVTAGATARGQVRAFNQNGTELQYQKQTSTFLTQPKLMLSAALTAGGVNFDMAANFQGEATLLLTPKSGKIQPLVMNISKAFVRPYPMSGVPGGGSTGNVIGKLVRQTDASPFSVIAGVKDKSITFRLFTPTNELYWYMPKANLQPYKFANGVITNTQPQINKISVGPIDDNGNMTLSWQTDKSVKSTVKVGTATYSVTALSGMSNVKVPAVSGQTVTATIQSCLLNVPAAQGCNTLGARNFMSF